MKKQSIQMMIWFIVELFAYVKRKSKKPGSVNGWETQKYLK